MLINTVLVYIRELLPVLLLLATLLRLEQQRRWLLYSILCTALLLIFLPPWLNDLTQLVDGTGLELLFVVAHIITLLAISSLSVKRTLQPAAVLAVCAQSLLCGINLLLFSLTNTGSDVAAESFLLGAVLGCGIGLSIAVLWYQLLSELQRLSRIILGIMLALIAARQSIETVTLLGQIDWLPSGGMLWDSSSVIAEQTEAGVFFPAWFGYEATPDVIQLGAWLVTVVLILMLWQWRRGMQ